MQDFKNYRSPMEVIKNDLPLSASGKKLSVATMARWWTKGLCGGIKLKVVRIGGRVYLPPGSLEEFFLEVERARSNHTAAPLKTDAITDAERELDAEGFDDPAENKRGGKK